MGSVIDDSVTTLSLPSKIHSGVQNILSELASIVKIF
jgi:hypothetical protein